MADTEVEIREAIDAIRYAAASRATISLPAIEEIRRCVVRIVNLTRHADIEREGARLLSSAMGTYSNPENKVDIVLAARLHGAVGRFEFALQQLGFLPQRDDPPTQFARRSLAADC
jgi:hypothetical protein